MNAIVYMALIFNDKSIKRLLAGRFLTYCETPFQITSDTQDYASYLLFKVADSLY